MNICLNERTNSPKHLIPQYSVSRILTSSGLKAQVSLMFRVWDDEISHHRHHVGLRNHYRIIRMSRLEAHKT
jgi:hypothetical protein